MDDARRILAQALELPSEDRALLATLLVDSLGDGTPADELRAAWDAEVARRLEAVRSGESRPIPFAHVERRLQAMLERHGAGTETSG